MTEKEKKSHNNEDILDLTLDSPENSAVKDDFDLTENDSFKFAIENTTNTKEKLTLPKVLPIDSPKMPPKMNSMSPENAVSNIWGSDNQSKYSDLHFSRIDERKLDLLSLSGFS